MPTTAALRSHVLALLDGGGAHPRARDVLRGFPRRHAGERAAGFAHSAWELLEHLRIAQHDILRYGLDPKHRSPKWPQGYWPRSPKPPNAAAWDRSAKAFLADLRACLGIARDRRIDLLAPLPHAKDASWLRELILVADHDAWHLGQLMQLRRALETLDREGARRAIREGGQRARGERGRLPDRERSPASGGGAARRR